MDTYATLIPYFDPKGTSYSWQEAATPMVQKKAGMYLIGAFITRAFPAAQVDDIDFFSVPGHRPGHPARRGGADRRLLRQREEQERRRHQGPADLPRLPGAAAGLHRGLRLVEPADLARRRHQQVLPAGAEGHQAAAGHQGDHPVLQPRLQRRPADHRRRGADQVPRPSPTHVDEHPQGLADGRRAGLQHDRREPRRRRPGRRAETRAAAAPRPARRARSPPGAPVVWVLLLVPFAIELFWVFWPAAQQLPALLHQVERGRRWPSRSGCRTTATSLDDPIFLTAIKNNVFWVLAFGGLSVVGGLALAVALNKPRRGVGLYRSAIYLPMVFSLAVTGLFWRVLYQPDGADQHRARLHRHRHQEHQWLADPTTALWAILIAAIWRQVGYIMVLYLAGLKGCDPTLEEAAAVDGANALAAVRAIVMPQLRSVNTVVFAVTVIDSLRTFDIVWAMTRGGPYNSTQLLSTYMFQQRFTLVNLGYGSAIAVVIFAAGDRLHHHLPRPRRPGGGLTCPHSPHLAAPARRRDRPTGAGPAPPAPRGLHAAMTPVTLLWIAPIVFVIFVAIRSFDDIAAAGWAPGRASFSIGASPPPDSTAASAERSATASSSPHHGVPGAVPVLARRLRAQPVRHPVPAAPSCSPCSPETCCRRRSCSSRSPRSPRPSASTTPAPRSSSSRSGSGIGFYTFVLHGFMRSLPNEVFEAATARRRRRPADLPRASCCPCPGRRWRRSAALASTWIFNDLIWAMTVLRTETKFPITAALLNLQGGYASAWNVVAAGSLIAAIPTAIVFFMFQKHFVSGLLVGANK